MEDFSDFDSKGIEKNFIVLNIINIFLFENIYLVYD